MLLLQLTSHDPYIMFLQTKPANCSRALETMRSGDIFLLSDCLAVYDSWYSLFLTLRIPEYVRSSPEEESI